MTNPFEELASTQIASPVKSRMKAVETRRAKAAQAEKELEEEGKLLTLYRRHKKEQVSRLLSGPFGPQVVALLTVMRSMGLDSAPELIRYAQGSAWIKQMSIDDRFVLLRLIGRAITKLREKNGLLPFDDGVIGEPAKAFERIKTEIGVR